MPSCGGSAARTVDPAPLPGTNGWSTAASPGPAAAKPARAGLLRGRPREADHPRPVAFTDGGLRESAGNDLVGREEFPGRMLRIGRNNGCRRRVLAQGARERRVRVQRRTRTRMPRPGITRSSWTGLDAHGRSLQPVPCGTQGGPQDQNRGVFWPVKAVLQGVRWCLAHPSEPLICHNSPYERGPGCSCLTRWKTSRAA